MEWLGFLDGLKSFIGGAVLVGGGVAGMVFGVIDPGTAAMLIGNGFGVWGIAGKIEKVGKTMKEGNNNEDKVAK